MNLDGMSWRVGPSFVGGSSDRQGGAYVSPDRRGGYSGPSVSRGPMGRQGGAYVPPDRRGAYSRPSVSGGPMARQTGMNSPQMARIELQSSLADKLQRDIGDTPSGHMWGSTGLSGSSSERRQGNRNPITRPMNGTINVGSNQRQEWYAPRERSGNVALGSSTLSDKSNEQAGQDTRSVRNTIDTQNSQRVPGQIMSSSANTERRPYDPVYRPRSGRFDSSEIPRFLRFLYSSCQKPQVIYENRVYLDVVIRTISQSGPSEYLNQLIEIFTDPSVKRTTSDHRSDNFSIFVNGGNFVLEGQILLLALTDSIPEKIPEFIGAIASTDRGLLMKDRRKCKRLYPQTETSLRLLLLHL